MAISRRQSRLRGRPLGKTESADFASKVRESSITQLGKIKQVGEQKVADQAKAAQTIVGQGPVAAVAPPVLQPKPVETLVAAPAPLSWKQYAESLGKPTRPEMSAVSGESPDPHGVGDPYGSVSGVQAMGALSDAQAAQMAGKGFQAIGQMATGNVPGSIATMLGQKGTIDQAKGFVDAQLGQLGGDPASAAAAIGAIAGPIGDYGGGTASPSANAGSLGVGLGTGAEGPGFGGPGVSGASPGVGGGKG